MSGHRNLGRGEGVGVGLSGTGGGAERTGVGVGYGIFRRPTFNRHTVPSEQQQSWGFRRFLVGTTSPRHPPT